MRKEKLEALVALIESRVKGIMETASDLPGEKTFAADLSRHLRKALESAEECDVDGVRRNVSDAWELVAFAGMFAGYTSMDNLIKAELEVVDMMKEFTAGVLSRLTDRCSLKKRW